MVQSTKVSRPVIDGVLNKLVARNKEFKRATSEIFESIWFAKNGIIKYLELPTNSILDFETIDMVGHEIIIQVSSPADELVNVFDGNRDSKMFTISLPFDIVSAHDDALIAEYLENMTEYDASVEELEIDQLEDLLVNGDTVKFEVVERRVIH